MVSGSRDSVQAQVFQKLHLDPWEGRRGLYSQGGSSGYPGIPPDLFCISQDSDRLLARLQLACYFGLHKSIPLGLGMELSLPKCTKPSRSPSVPLSITFTVRHEAGHNCNASRWAGPEDQNPIEPVRGWPGYRRLALKRSER